MFFGLFSKEPFDERLKKLDIEITQLYPYISKWPPRIKNAEEKSIIWSKWHKAEKIARKLVDEQPDSYEALVKTGDLMRLGHNMDVPMASVHCQSLLNEAIRVNPNGYMGYFLLACLYTQAPDRVEDAINYFLKSEKLVSPIVIPDIYQGLGFAHLLKKDFPAALKYFEQYVHIAGNSAEPDALKVIENLKLGKSPTTHYVPPAP